jgi:hypothetical protein
MALGSKTDAFSLTLSVVVLSLDGAHAAMAVVSVAATTPKALLLDPLAPVASVLLLDLEALDVVEASVDHDSVAIVAEVALVVVVTVVVFAAAISVAAEVVVVEAAVVALATSQMATVPRMAPHLVLVVGLVAVVVVAAASTEVVEEVAVTEMTGAATVAAVTEDQVVRTTNLWAAAIEPASEIAKVGIVAETTMAARANVGMRVIATTIRDSSDGGTELQRQLSPLSWVCQKVTSPSYLVRLTFSSPRVRSAALHGNIRHFFQVSLRVSVMLDIIWPTSSTTLLHHGILRAFTTFKILSGTLWTTTAQEGMA